MKNLNDAEIVAAAASGDQMAFRELMRRYSPAVIAFLLGRTRNSTETQDLAQEVFLSAYLHLSSLKKKEALGGWLLRIAQNKLNDYLRNLRRERALGLLETSPEDDDRTLDVSHLSPDPSQRAADQQMSQIVMRCLAGLGDKYRVVVYLKLIEGLNSREIAAQLGLKESAVRMRLQRGLKTLREAVNAATQ